MVVQAILTVKIQLKLKMDKAQWPSIEVVRNVEKQ